MLFYIYERKILIKKTRDANNINKLKEAYTNFDVARCECMAWRFPKRSGFKSRYVPIFIRFLNNYKKYIIFPCPCPGNETKRERWVPRLHTQCLKNSAEGGERSVLILGSQVLLHVLKTDILHKELTTS